ncbi:MAG: hypothetical protein ACOYNS_17670, partial [Bacteroidota bacterium]
RVVDGIGGGGKYAKISDAITASTTGDTIDVLQGTYTEATTISIPKRLVIIGAGYRSNGTIIKKTILSFSDLADNSKLYGFRFDTGYVALEANADNILIAENNFLDSYLYLNGNTGDTVRNNLFIFKTSISPISSAYNIALTNFNICNNIFDGANASNGLYAIYLRVQGVNQSNIRIFNNFFGETSYTLGGDWNAMDGISYAGNVVYKVTGVTAAASTASLYSGNWLFGMTGTPIQPVNGFDNGSGDPQFTRFDVVKGFVFVGDTAQDSDMRIKTTATAFPNSLVDGSYRSIPPMPLNYIDVQQQPGVGNTNKADAGIFGGPYPFKSPFVPSTVPGVSSITATSTTTGGIVVSPKGVVKVDVKGSFGGTSEPKTGE